jgi:hypothetical protein
MARRSFREGGRLTHDAGQRSGGSTEPGILAEVGVEAKPEDHSRRSEELAGWPVTIETFRLGSVYHCTIANVDPGARIARADGSTREEAESRAIEKATRYLAQTRKF